MCICVQVHTTPEGIGTLTHTLIHQPIYTFRDIHSVFCCPVPGQGRVRPKTIRVTPVPYLLACLAVALCLITLLPLSIRRDWWIRAMDFPRLQVAILSAAWLLVWYLLDVSSAPWLNLVAIVVGAILVYQCYWIYPHSELHAQEVHRYHPEFDGKRPTIKLLTSNVLMTNRNSATLLELVGKHQPDVLIALESDLWWQEQLDTLTGYPHRIACPLDNLYGMHVYSRLPLADSIIEYRVEEDKPSISTRVEVAEGVSIQLHVVHPAPPAPGENDESTERDVELILLAKALAGDPDRIIVAGDLNDVAWSATTRLFRQISGLLDPRIGRGLFNTFNAMHWFARWPLDHVFVSPHFKVSDIQRLPAIGSDHFPLLVELAIIDGLQDSNSVEHDEKDEERLDSILSSPTAKSAKTPTKPASSHSAAGTQIDNIHPLVTGFDAPDKTCGKPSV